MESIEDEGVSTATAKTKASLSLALDRVAHGMLGIEGAGVTMPIYPGLLCVWNYARDVRKALLLSLDMTVKLTEDDARIVTSDGVNKIGDLGDQSLPEDVGWKRRVFIPDAMFRTWKKKKSDHKRRLSSSSLVMGLGVHGLGIGLPQRPDMLETTFFDLFDVRHQLWVHFGGAEGKTLDEEDSLPSALGVLSVGVGALTMVGGQAIGARALIEGIVRVTDLLGNETARNWAAPVLGAVTIGLTAYFVCELSNSIPRMVGRRIKGCLGAGHVDGHAERVGKETRKVLRIASWDLREQFRATMEAKGKEVSGAEELERKVKYACEWLMTIQERTGEVRVNAKLGSEIV